MECRGRALADPAPRATVRLTRPVHLPVPPRVRSVASRVKSPLLKQWLKLQATLFAPVTTLLVALGWQLYLHPRHMLRTKHYDELS